MGEFTADKSHPRYESLLRRHNLEVAANKGMLADSALIAHGRGEAFDYLLGENTSHNALLATKNALAHLSTAKRPIITINGNTAALAGKELLQIAQCLGCPVEINIFYRTDRRISVMLDHLETIKEEHDISTEILGENPVQFFNSSILTDEKFFGSGFPSIRVLKKIFFFCFIIRIIYY